MSEPSSELRDRAQALFDATPPLKHSDGTRVRISFPNWRKDTQTHFLKLAELTVSREN